MPRKTNSQRQKEWLARVKADPVLFEEYQEKQRQKYQKRKQAGKVKGTNNCSKREKRKIRRQWKVNSQNYRNRERAVLTAVENICTPPSTPAEAAENNRPARGRPPIKNINRTKAYRKVARLEQQLEEKDRLVDKYKKRCQRLKNKHIITDSPGRKADSLISTVQRTGQKNDIRRTLVFHYALLKGMKETPAQRNLMKNLKMSVLKKYRCIDKMRMSGFSKKIMKEPFRMKVRLAQKCKEMKNSVKEFLTRDDNSRISANKKDIHSGTGLQKRYLLHSLKMLHKKYTNEAMLKVSYSYFCRNRPAQVVIPQLKDRTVCICKVCDNFSFKIEKLFQEGVVSYKDPEEFVENSVTCSTGNMACMYRVCLKCKKNKIKLTKESPDSQKVAWYVWQNEIHVYLNKSNEEKETRKTVKKRIEGSLSNLVKVTNEAMPIYLSHLYRVYHQYNAITSIKENLPDHHCILHFDFSENWKCKYSREITSVHFGASQQQATLHDGLIYVNGGNISFCSISDSNNHEAPAVFAHLSPVLAKVREMHPNIEHLHMVTDSPSSQYRNKNAFYLMTTIPEQHGFKSVTWNYLESGHGKGAADGIGATIKRKADALVAQGNDVETARKLFDILMTSGTSVQLFFVTNEAIMECQKSLPEIKSYPGTMRVHQVRWDKSHENQENRVTFRNFSCYCRIDEARYCECYHPKIWSLRHSRSAVSVEQNNHVVEIHRCLDTTISKKPVNQKAPVLKKREMHPCIDTNISKKPVNQAKKRRLNSKRLYNQEDIIEELFREDAIETSKVKQINLQLDWQCLVCSECYTSSAPEDDWIQCCRCNQWAHELCTSYDGEAEFICDICEDV